METIVSNKKVLPPTFVHPTAIGFCAGKQPIMFYLKKI